MNILIADSFRSRLISEAFSKTDVKIFYFSDEGAIKPTDPGERFLLRFRHGSQFGSDEIYGKLPSANLNICIGGFASEQYKKHDEVFFYKLLSIDKGITEKDALDLLRYVADMNSKTPACLLPETFNQNLEYELKTKHQAAIIFKQIDLPKINIRENAKVLVAWPDLLMEGEEEFLKTQLTEKIITGKHTVNKVTDLKMWESLAETISDFDAAFICAELGWRSEYLTDFEGIDYLARIRRSGFRAPIILCSHAAWTDIYKMIEINSKRFDILKTPGQYFINLQTGIMPDDAIKELTFYTKKPGINPSCRLSTAILDDILYYILDPRGQLHNYMHSLKNRMTDTPREAKEDIEKLFTGVLRQLVPPVNYIRLNRIKENILAKTVSMDTSAIYVDCIQPFMGDLEALIPSADGSMPPSKESGDILYVDDQQKAQGEVKRFFEQYGLHCHTADTVEEAISILKKDYVGGLGNKPNSITLLITDFRLLVADRADSRWQPMQGLDLINYVHLYMPNILSFAILTNKRGILMRRAQKTACTQISWFSKELLSNEATARFFLEDICALREEAFSTLEKMPDSESWKYGSPGKFGPLSDWYSYYRNAPLYGEIEKDINRLALDFLYLNEIRNNRITNPIEDPKITEDRIRASPFFTCGFTSKLVKEVAGSKTADLTTASITDDLDNFKSNHGRKFYEEYPKNAPGKLIVFAAKLLGRRVTIALADQIGNLHGDKKLGQVAIEQIYFLLRLWSRNANTEINPGLFIQHFALSVDIEKIRKAKKLEEEEAFLSIATSAVREWRRTLTAPTQTKI